MESTIKLVKVTKDEKTYYNVYVLGVAVKPVNDKDYAKLRYAVQTYCTINNIDIPAIDKSTVNGKVEKK